MRNRHDLTGQRFGSLVVIGFDRSTPVKNGTVLWWLCRCDCGNTKSIRGPNLCRTDAAKTSSCGCVRVATRTKLSTKHGMGGKHEGKDRPREYVSWLAMKDRCNRATRKDFANYGGRGITVCDRWANSFKSFYSDMGPCPKGLTLDRVDNDGNYEPGNCRWATRSTQRRNQRVS